MLPVCVSSYLHSELSQLRCWERDVTKPGGREVENKAGAKAEAATQRQAF